MRPRPSSSAEPRPERTTILVSGLTMAHDLLVRAALGGIGYDVRVLDGPSAESLRCGKELGNGAGCNPTHVAVGRLLGYLRHLRDVEGKSVDEIVDGYAFVTAGVCGPCRFGTYAAEYRSALRAAGFADFRVMLFERHGRFDPVTGEERGLEIAPAFLLALLEALLVGDVLNLLGCRIRPYEAEPGATEAALERSRRILAEALREHRSILVALAKVRRELAAVRVDRTRIKPKVGIVGEFWAMATEGRSNRDLERFLEAEGAEVEIQIATAWLLHALWEGRRETRRRMALRGANGAQATLDGRTPTSTLVALWTAEKTVRLAFGAFGWIMGLRDYHLPEMNEMAAISARCCDGDSRAGEGPMEVGKIVLNIARGRVNMALSIEPFGCTPSASVSDGVRSFVRGQYPGGGFQVVEGTHDGGVGVPSRIRPALHAAHAHAHGEVERSLEEYGVTMDEVREFYRRHPRICRALHASPRSLGCTAADLVHEVGKLLRPLETLEKLWSRGSRGEPA